MRVTNDRRRKPRVRLAGAAVVHGGQAPIVCECIDLAIGGVGLRSSVKVKKGAKVGVVLSLHDRSVSLTAIVKRCRSQNRQWVLGLQFAAIDPESARVLEEFVEGAMHRDVRLYQAQVFLARAGARSLEEVLGTKGALEGAPTPAKTKAPVEDAAVAEVVDHADGSSPITLDEPARGVAASSDAVPEPTPRDVTGPWSPSSPPHADPRSARSPTQPWAPAPAPPVSPTPVPETSADLRHAVASALHDMHHELGEPHADAEPSWPAASKPESWDAPAKGGTMLRPNPLFGAPDFAIPPARTGATMVPPSAIVTSPGLRPGAEPPAPASFVTDVSALSYDDAHGSDGRRHTTVVDPRALAEPSPGVRPPPLRVERSASGAASFQPRIDDLELDDAPTRMFGDAPPQVEEPAPVIKRRSLPGETQIGPAPTRDESRRFDTPPSPFGGGRVRSVVPPPSATSTLVNVGAAVDAPTPVPIPGRDDVRTPDVTAQTGATQVAIQAPRTMPYGPVRGESTQVAIPPQGLAMPRPPREEATGSGGPRPPSPFRGPERPPPSPFTGPGSAAPRPAGAAPLRPIDPFTRKPGERAKAGVEERGGPSPRDSRHDRGIDEAATRLRAHPMHGADDRADAAPTDEEDTDFAAQYGRALTDLDLESR
jgi:hypothetical protein